MGSALAAWSPPRNDCVMNVNWVPAFAGMTSSVGMTSSKDRTVVEHADVAVVGGGMVGSAAAYFLAAEKRFPGRIVLIERDTSYRDGSTARSAGGVRQQFSTPENINLSRFTLELFAELKSRFGADADVSYREQGYLVLGGPEGAG